MKGMLASAAAFAVIATSVTAEIRYDRKLEAAVMERVAARIGDIRGGFGPGRAAVFLRLSDPIVTGSVEKERAAELRGAIALPPPQADAKRKVSRIVF